MLVGVVTAVRAADAPEEPSRLLVENPRVPAPNFRIVEAAGQHLQPFEGPGTEVMIELSSSTPMNGQP
ncbi:MAG: hypothetical protein ACREA0_13020 [bacterium]